MLIARYTLRVSADDSRELHPPEFPAWIYRHFCLYCHGDPKLNFRTLDFSSHLLSALYEHVLATHPRLPPARNFGLTA